MRRRNFLKLFAIAAVAPLIPIGLMGVRPVEAAANGVAYRGDGGHIHTSQNAGQTWQVHTNFGSQYTIRALSLDPSGRLRARVEFAGRSFDLVLSSQGKFWNTIM